MELGQLFIDDSGLTRLYGPEDAIDSMLYIVDSLIGSIEDNWSRMSDEDRLQAWTVLRPGLNKLNVKLTCNAANMRGCLTMLSRWLRLEGAWAVEHDSMEFLAIEDALHDTLAHIRKTGRCIGRCRQHAICVLCNPGHIDDSGRQVQAIGKQLRRMWLHDEDEDDVSFNPQGASDEITIHDGTLFVTLTAETAACVGKAVLAGNVLLWNWALNTEELISLWI